MYNLYKPFDFLSKDECQEIINHGRTHEPHEAMIGKSPTSNTTQRKCKICWYDHNNKKYKEKILKVFKTFNKNIFLKDDLQITFYKPNDFYSWHFDTLRRKKKWWMFFSREIVRLLSITVELQPAPKAGLYLDTRAYPDIPRNEDLSIKLKQGQAIVFPSKIIHMAQNKGDGERISLVSWGSEITKH